MLARSNCSWKTVSSKSHFAGLLHTQFLPMGAFGFTRWNWFPENFCVSIQTIEYHAINHCPSCFSLHSNICLFSFSLPVPFLSVCGTVLTKRPFLYLGCSTVHSPVQGSLLIRSLNAKHSTTFHLGNQTTENITVRALRAYRPFSVGVRPLTDALPPSHVSTL